DPSELIIPEKLQKDPEFESILAEYKARLTILPDTRFHAENAKERVKKTFGALESLGELSEAELAACGTILDYIELTQKGKIPSLKKIQKQQTHTSLEIDSATIRNLELIRPLIPEHQNTTLLSCIDRTVTNSGARLLRQHLLNPLCDPEAIN